MFLFGHKDYLKGSELGGYMCLDSGRPTKYGSLAKRQHVFWARPDLEATPFLDGFTGKPKGKLPASLKARLNIDRPT